MSHSFIDSASIMNTVGALTYYENCEEWNEWTRRSITDVTRMLITHRLLKISPGPSPSLSKPAHAHSELYKYYDQSCSRLGEIIEDTTQKEKNIPRNYGDQLSSEKDFNDWLRNNIGGARDAIMKTKQESSYPQWIEWAIKQAWVDHSYRLNGLFNAEMIDGLSPILEVSSKDMKNLWKKTINLQQVKRWSQGQNLNSDFELAQDAFVASAILRGRFHEFISSQKGWQLMHHPIRQHILAPLPENTDYVFSIPEPLEYLVNIIAHSAMEEQNPKDKVSRWTDNILKTRRSYLSGKIEFNQKELDKKDPEDIAIETVQKLQLRLYSRSTEKYLRSAITLGSPITIGIALFPWGLLGTLLGAGIGAGVSILEMKMEKPLSERILEGWTLTKGNLRKLATSPAGRIVRIERDMSNRDHYPHHN